MPSNASRGSYYKKRSKKWLEAHGYQVGHLEVMRVIFTPDGPIPTKRDQWGSDLLAMRADEGKPIFVQVKSGLKPNLAEARRKFKEHVFARDTRRVIHVWTPGAREPQVFECK